MLFGDEAVRLHYNNRLDVFENLLDLMLVYARESISSIFEIILITLILPKDFFPI